MTLSASQTLFGNTVVYGFVHYNRQLTHNPLVPVLGMSGGLGICMVAFYDPVHDVLMYVLTTPWFDGHKSRFEKEGMLLLWLCLHHRLFLRQLCGSKVRSGLHKRFTKLVGQWTIRKGVYTWHGPGCTYARKRTRCSPSCLCN